MESPGGRATLGLKLGVELATPTPTPTPDSRHLAVEQRALSILCGERARRVAWLGLGLGVGVRVRRVSVRVIRVRSKVRI